MKSYIIFWILTLCNISAFADLLKPALVETTVFDNSVEIQMSLSLEAMLSGISTNLKNTKQAKNEDAYQQLRVLQPQELLDEFLLSKDTFLKSINELIQTSPKKGRNRDNDFNNIECIGI